MFTPRVKGTKRDFLKMNPGQKLTGVFRGDVYQFKQHWNQATRRGEVCPGKEKCKVCQEGTYPAFRFRVNFVFNENGQLVSRIFEGGGKTYDSLVSLGEDYDLTQHFVTIGRQGSGTETTYSILPTPKGEMSASQVDQIKAVPLQPLEHDPEPESAAEEEPAFTEDNIPF